MLCRIRIFIDGKLVHEEEKEIALTESGDTDSTGETGGGGQ